MLRFTKVKDLHGWSSEWRICVKVLRKWRKLDDTEDSIEMVVSDIFGDKIQVTIPADLKDRFNPQFHEDEWKVLENFNVQYFDLPMKLCDNDSRIILIDETLVEHSEVLSNNQFIDYLSFDRILDGYHAIRNLSIDVMGEVVNVRTMIHVVNPNAPQNYVSLRLIQFSLRDLSGNEIQCVAYNQHADYFIANRWPLGIRPVVAVLRFWRVHYLPGGEGMKVVSGGPASRIYFNPSFPEVLDFQRRIEYNNGSDNNGGED